MGGEAEVVRLSSDLNPHFVQRRSRIEPDGIAVARTGNGGDGEAKEIVRRFERALARGKFLDRAADADTEQPKSLDRAKEADTEQPKSLDRAMDADTEQPK